MTGLKRRELREKLAFAEGLEEYANRERYAQDEREDEWYRAMESDSYDGTLDFLDDGYYDPYEDEEYYGRAWLGGHDYDYDDWDEGDRDYDYDPWSEHRDGWDAIAALSKLRQLFTPSVLVKIPRAVRLQVIGTLFQNSNPVDLPDPKR